MKKIVIFNWKMAPGSLKEAERLFTQTQTYADLKRTNAEVVVAAPFVYLLNLKTKKLKNLKLASQDVFWENPPAGGGAYTGEISAEMLKNLGVEYVIIGHSERRQHLGETDKMINKKVKVALKTGLKVILCVGEDLKIRKKGKKAVEKFVKNQLQKDLKGITKSLIVVYEPIWAISTSIGGHSITPQDAVEIIKFIKQTLKTKSYKLKANVLYGGSVNGKNIKDFIRHKEIDGVLVGGASLKIKEVKKILA
ncbi:MAG: triose-phosphate isomerase [Candidatus Paceibacterota bacterium]